MQERQRSWSAVRDWTFCRVQTSFHKPSVVLEWAATASSAMAASTGCTRTRWQDSSAWQKDPDYRCTRCRGTACPLDGRPQNDVQVGPDKLEVVASFCYLGDMLSAAGGSDISTTTCENRPEEVQGSATSSLLTPPLFQDTFCDFWKGSKKHHISLKW